MSTRVRQTLRNRSFLEAIAVLFGLGVILEFLLVALSKTGEPGWLWFLTGIAALLAGLWFVAPEPPNLWAPPPRSAPRWGPLPHWSDTPLIMRKASSGGTK